MIKQCLINILNIDWLQNMKTSFGLLKGTILRSQLIVLLKNKVS